MSCIDCEGCRARANKAMSSGNVCELHDGGWCEGCAGCFDQPALIVSPEEIAADCISKGLGGKNYEALKAAIAAAIRAERSQR